MIMARMKFDLRSDTYRKVLGFLFGHWARQPGRRSRVQPERAVDSSSVTGLGYVARVEHCP